MEIADPAFHIEWQARLPGKKEILRAIYPKCWICRLPFGDHPHLARTIDHFVPRSKGGGNELDNLRYAHRFCNQQRGNKLGKPSNNFRASCHGHIRKLLKRSSQITEAVVLVKDVG